MPYTSQTLTSKLKVVTIEDLIFIRVTQYCIASFVSAKQWEGNGRRILIKMNTSVIYILYNTINQLYFNEILVMKKMDAIASPMRFIWMLTPKCCNTIHKMHDLKIRSVMRVKVMQNLIRSQPIGRNN